MDPDPPTAIVVPIDLGAVASFDQHVFPLAYYNGGNNLSKGSLLIRATLDEMKKIKELGIDLNKNENFIFNTRVELEALKAEKTRLQETRKTLNPYKAFRNYRAVRLFHDASRALFLQTKRTSEKIHREKDQLRIVPSSHVRAVDDSIPADAKITAITIPLPNGWDEDARQTINDATMVMAAMNPFRDNSIAPQLGDDERDLTLIESQLSQDASSSDTCGGIPTSAASSNPYGSPPTSPQTINITNMNIYQSMIATNSNFDSVTQSHGSQNSGGP